MSIVAGYLIEIDREKWKAVLSAQLGQQLQYIKTE